MCVTDVLRATDPTDLTERCRIKTRSDAGADPGRLDDSFTQEKQERLTLSEQKLVKTQKQSFEIELKWLRK